MEKLVFSLYGLWFWLTRKYRSAVYNEAAEALNAAQKYLWDDYATRASTIDRGSLLPQHIEALELLERHRSLTTRASRSFDSLQECCRFIAEELSEFPISQPALVPLTPGSISPEVTAASALAPVATALPSLASFASFLTFEEVGQILQPRWTTKGVVLPGLRVSPAAMPSANAANSLHPKQVDVAA